MDIEAQCQTACEWSYGDELAKAIRGKMKATQDHTGANRSDDEGG